MRLKAAGRTGKVSSPSLSVVLSEPRNKDLSSIVGVGLVPREHGTTKEINHVGESEILKFPR